MGCILRAGKKEWSNGTLPYIIRTSDFTARQLNEINAAIAHWNTKTNWRIIPRTNQRNYVCFRRGPGCSSPIGCVGGGQDIKLASDCNTGTIIHEIGHAIGFAHEHNRKDRDNYVTVLHDRVISDKRHNFQRVNSGEYRDHGEYDYNSIMHYGRGGFVRPKLYDWTAGYNTIDIQSEGNANLNLFVLKSSNGDAHNFRLKTDFIGHELSRHNWNSGWTTAKFYTIGSSKYLFLLKKSDGLAQVRRVSFTGEIGSRIKAYDWTSGWTNVDFYKIGSKTFLLLWKSGTGDCHIHQMNTNGTVGRKLFDYKFSRGYNIIKTFEVGNQLFLWRQSTSSGKVYINAMAPNGQINAQVSGTPFTWTSGWNTAEFYTIGSRTFLFILKSSNGINHVYQMNANGSVGRRVDRQDWTSGWDKAKFYKIGNTPRLFLLKSRTGDAQIHKVGSSGKILGRLPMKPEVTIIAPRAIGQRRGLSPQDTQAANDRI